METIEPLPPEQDKPQFFYARELVSLLELQPRDERRKFVFSGGVGRYLPSSRSGVEAADSFGKSFQTQWWQLPEVPGQPKPIKRRYRLTYLHEDDTARRLLIDCLVGDRLTRFVCESRVGLDQTNPVDVISVYIYNRGHSLELDGYHIELMQEILSVAPTGLERGKRHKEK